MKKGTKIKIIAIAAVLVVVAGAIGIYTYAARRGSSVPHSFEYIEQIKAKYKEGDLSFRILEIAPTGDESIFGYLVGGSEPVRNWLQVASMYNDRQNRVNYVTDLFKYLDKADLISPVKDKAPLTLDDTYEEWYPWEKTYNPATDKILTLDYEEKVNVKGQMVEAENGEYAGNYDYVLAGTNYVDRFDFNQLNIKLSRVTELNFRNGIRNKASKIYAVDNITHVVTVFGSTEKNWADNSGENFMYDYAYYDLAAVNKLSRDKAYLIKVEPGKTYSLVFDYTVKNSKGQVLVIPFNDSGKVVKYNPNYSNQYALRDEYLEVNPATGIDEGTKNFQFTVPEGSGITTVQIRFDVADIDGCFTASNIHLYEYEDQDENKAVRGSIFDISKHTNPNATVSSTYKNIKLDANGGNDRGASLPTSSSTSYNFIECQANKAYTLTYHVECKNGAVPIVKLGIYDESKHMIGSAIDATCSEDSTGETFSKPFETPIDAKYIVVTFGIKAGSGTCSYSHVSITLNGEDGGYLATGKATHIQSNDHFQTGEPVASLSIDNIFNKDTWYASGSNQVNDSTKIGKVESNSEGVITIISGSSDSGSSGNVTKTVSTKYSTGKYVQSDTLYYMAVKPNTKYQISFKVTLGNETDKITFGAYVSDENREGIRNGSTTKEISASDLDETRTYTTTVTTPAGASFLQISFATTQYGQTAQVSNVEIFEYYMPKVYYYNVIAKPIDIRTLTDDQAFEGDIALYKINDDYTAVGIMGDPSFTYDSSEKYYRYDVNNSRYVRVSGRPADGTTLYKAGELYVYAGHYGEFSADLDLEYFTLEPNYKGYVVAKEDNVKENIDLYRHNTDGSYSFATKYTSQKMIDDETFRNNFNEGMYYIHIATVSETPDPLHPYYMESIVGQYKKVTQEMKNQGIVPLFVQNIYDYTFVSTGGEFNFVPGDGNVEVTLYTDIIYYKGGFTNNEWFKRFVLDSKRDDPADEKEELDSYSVKVVTYTPNTLNLFDNAANKTSSPDEPYPGASTELTNAVNGYELVVMSSGLEFKKNGSVGYATYDTSIDIRDDVRNTLIDLMVLQDEKDMADASIPTVVDLQLIKSGSTPENIKAVAQKVCEVDATNQSVDGVKDYTYRFNGDNVTKDSPSKYLANHNFISDMDNSKKFYQSDPRYKEAWELISYENALRYARGMYDPLDNFLSEATCIRHILNFKGERTINTKPLIRILEVEPMSTESVLYSKKSEKTATKTIDVRKWFTDIPIEQFDASDDDNVRNVKYVYTDSSGIRHTDGITRFEIVTTTPHELSGKIEDIAENFDLIYIGASLDGFDETYYESERTKDGEFNKDFGDTYPIYNGSKNPKGDSHLNGFYYTSTGNTKKVVSTNISANMGGLLRHDYRVIGNIWRINDIDYECILRDAGNDICDTRMQQIQEMIDQGLPIVVSDELALQDYSSKLYVQVMGKTYYQRSGRKVYLPGYENNDEYSFTATENKSHVCLTAKVHGEIPQGTKVQFQWYYIPDSVPLANLNQDSNGDGLPDKAVMISVDDFERLSFAWLRRLVGKPGATAVDNKDYVQIDSDGDGIADLFCIDFDPTIKKTDSEGHLIKQHAYDNGYYFCKVNFDFSECRSSLGQMLRYNGLFENAEKKDVYSNKIQITDEDRTYKIHYFDYSDNPDYKTKFKTFVNAQQYGGKGLCWQQAGEGGEQTNISINVGNFHSEQTLRDDPLHNFDVDSDHQMFVAVEPVPEKFNDNVLYRAIATQAIDYNWREVGAEYSIVDPRYQISPVYYEKRLNGSFLNWHSIYYKTWLKIVRYNTTNDNPYGDYELCLYSNQDGTEMKNKGFCLYFNDEGVKNKGQRVSVGGYGSFKISYTATKNREKDTNGYILSLYGCKEKTDNDGVLLRDSYGNTIKEDYLIEDAEGYVERKGDFSSCPNVKGGYNIPGRDKYGNPVLGAPTEYNYRCSVYDARVDNCSNMYDLLSTSMGNDRNAFTQNELERHSDTYRLIFRKYASLSQPTIEMISEPVNYPQQIEDNKLDFSFKILNDTDVNNLNSRYKYALYIDSNCDGQFVESERVNAKIIGLDEKGNAGLKSYSKGGGYKTYELTYDFKNSQGVSLESYYYNWRFKVWKIGDEGCHNSYYGTAYKEPSERTVVRAIQILPSDWDPEYVQLSAARTTGSVFFVKGEKDNPYGYNAANSGNLYKGSVFLSDVYVSDEIRNGSAYGSGSVERIIWYKDSKDGVPYAGTKNEKYIPVAGKYVDHVQFNVGNMYQLEIYFTNLYDMDDTKSPGMMKTYNMVIMGYGDSWGKMGLGKTQNAIDLPETMGFHKEAAEEVERVIFKKYGDIPVLFCHDSVMYHVNFINYWANDALSFANSAVNTVTNWWNGFKTDVANVWYKITNQPDKVSQADYNKYNGDIHTSRVKNGYYQNLILREPGGQDRYGVTYMIKQRAGYKYEDSNLKAAHNYNNLYDSHTDKANDGFTAPLSLENMKYYEYNDDGSKTVCNMSSVNYYESGVQKTREGSYNEWKKIFRDIKDTTKKSDFISLNKGSTEYAVLAMEQNGFSISWVPGSDKLNTDQYVQGFTTYTVNRFTKGDDAGLTMTNRVSQVNVGQLTSYPFDVNVPDVDTNGLYDMTTNYQTVMPTHDQYCQVNLNKNYQGEIATVWYCLAPGTGTYANSYKKIRNDCEDAYFIYTKGNVTYCGIGHSNTFTPFEAKITLNFIAGQGSNIDVAVTGASINDKYDNDVEYVSIMKANNNGSADQNKWYSDGQGNIIWKETLGFYLANQGGNDVTGETTRTVHFYIVDETKNEEGYYNGLGEEITDCIKLRETKEPNSKSPIECDSVELNTHYYYDIPDEVLAKLVENKSLKIGMTVETQQGFQTSLKTYEEGGKTYKVECFEILEWDAYDSDGNFVGHQRAICMDPNQYNLARQAAMEKSVWYDESYEYDVYDEQGHATHMEGSEANKKTLEDIYADTVQLDLVDLLTLR